MDRVRLRVEDDERRDAAEAHLVRLQHAERDARAAGVNIVTLPGPCAAIAALTLSGLPTDRFLFAGFLPAKAGARATAQPPTAPTAAPARAQEGAWTGMWSSTGTGHSGKLRCLVKVIPSEESGPLEKAQFTYHAVWGVFSGVFQTTQPIEPQKNDSLRSAGSWKLPRWAGGQYDYDMSLTGSRFEGSWTGGGDTGTFQLARPVPKEPGS